MQNKPKSTIMLYHRTQNVTVQSSDQLIKNIVVYDLLGRKIDSYKKVNALKHTFNHLNKTTIGLIVMVSKKIIF